MTPAVAGPAVGEASTIKMLRSVMMKGLEALTAECLLAARRAGVEGAVIASLQASDPGFDWQRRSAYNLERMMAHGLRRAAEMREVAATLRELGLPDRLAVATADWQQQVGALGLEAGEADAGGRPTASSPRWSEGEPAASAGVPRGRRPGRRSPGAAELGHRLAAGGDTGGRQARARGRHPALPPHAAGPVPDRRRAEALARCVRPAFGLLDPALRDSRRACG